MADPISVGQIQLALHAKADALSYRGCGEYGIIYDDIQGGVFAPDSGVFARRAGSHYEKMEDVSGGKAPRYIELPVEI